MRGAWSRTHVSASGSPSAKQHQAAFHLRVRQVRGLLAIQPGHHRLEAITRPAERSTRGLQRVGFHSGSFPSFRSTNRNVAQKEPLPLITTTSKQPATRTFSHPQKRCTLLIQVEGCSADGNAVSSVRNAPGVVPVSARSARVRWA
jgi:hypothetical protein